MEPRLRWMAAGGLLKNRDETDGLELPEQNEREKEGSVVRSVTLQAQSASSQRMLSGVVQSYNPIQRSSSHFHKIKLHCGNNTSTCLRLHLKILKGTRHF